MEEIVKFRVERDVFSEAVAWVARTLPTRPSLPVLAGMVMTADGDELTLSSFDYEISARVEIAVDVLTSGTALVSGRLLDAIAKSLPAQPVIMENEGSRITITCGRSTFTLPTLPVDDYPSLPDLPNTAGHISGGAFAVAVSQVAIAAGRDDTLPTLTGIRMEIEGHNIVLAATDRYRLAVREIGWTPETSNLSVNTLIPARTLADIAKALAHTDQVYLALGEGSASDTLMGFKGGGRHTTSRLLSGDFPKYRTLLPTEAATVATVETSKLADAVKRVSLVAERNTPVRLAFEGDEIHLSAGADDDARATEAVECSIQGDGMEIAFNPGYLLDGLSSIDRPLTRFSFTEPAKPAVLTGMSSSSDLPNEEYKYLLMPVRLTG